MDFSEIQCRNNTKTIVINVLFWKHRNDGIGEVCTINSVFVKFWKQKRYFVAQNLKISNLMFNVTWKQKSSYVAKVLF